MDNGEDLSPVVMVVATPLKYRDMKDLTLDSHVSYIFGKDPLEGREKGHILTPDIQKIFGLQKSLSDPTLREMATDFCHDMHQDLDESKDEKGGIIIVKHAPDERKLEEIMQYGLDHLDAQKLWHIGYRTVSLTGHVSMGLAVAAIPTSQRFMGKALSEKGKGNFGADPVDILQGVDAFLKGGALTAYTLMRVAPHHQYATTEHGWDHAKHILQNVYSDTKLAGLEVIDNPYLKQMWKMYAFIDLFLNLPGHLLASGKPVEELKAEAGAFAHTAEQHSAEFISNVNEHTGGIVHGVLSHIPGVGGLYKRHLEPIMQALPADLDTHNAIAGAAKQHMMDALDHASTAEYDATHQAASRRDNRLGALPLMRRNYWRDVLHTQDLSIVFGYMGKAGVAGLDLLRIYPHLAEKDQIHAALKHGYARYGGT